MGIVKGFAVWIFVVIVFFWGIWMLGEAERGEVYYLSLGMFGTLLLAVNILWIIEALINGETDGQGELPKVDAVKHPFRYLFQICVY